MKRIDVSLSDDLHQWLSDAAGERDGQSLTAYVRQILRAQMNADKLRQANEKESRAGLRRVK